MSKFLILFIACIGVVGIGSCAPLASTQPRANLYILNPVAVPAQKHVSGISLEVQKPQLPKSLASDKIALIRNTRELEYFANIKWAQSLDRVVQDALIRSFDAHFDAIDVGGRTANPNPDYRLITQIRDFQADYSDDASRPTLKAGFIFSLLELPSQEIVMRVSVDEHVTLDENKGALIAAGFEDVTHRALHQMLKNFTPILRDNR